jgi:Fic family protein
MKLPKEPPKKINPTDFAKVIVKNISKDNFNELVREFNEEYYYWEEILYRDTPKNISKENFWHYLKLERNKNVKKFNIGRYKFKYNLTNKILQRLHEFDFNLAGSLGNSVIPKEDKDKFFLSSIIEESINSSKLEGASTTIDVAKDMILNKKTPKDKSQRMILNNYNAMKKILELKNKKLTKELLLDLHKVITQDTLENKNYEGRFRNNNKVKVIDKTSGEVFHSPPNFSEIPELIDDLCKFYNNEGDFFIHPVVKANILHFLLGFIHPFYDGNGRTARCIFFLFLISNNYWLFEYLSISRIIIKSPSQYAKAYVYSELDENDLTYFIKYKTEKIDLAFNDLKEYIKLKTQEKEDSMKLFKTENITERQAEILGLFLKNNFKKITALEISERFNITKQTARSDLNNLVKLKFLFEKKSGNKILYFKDEKSIYQ